MAKSFVIINKINSNYDIAKINKNIYDNKQDINILFSKGLNGNLYYKEKSRRNVGSCHIRMVLIAFYYDKEENKNENIDNWARYNIQWLYNCFSNDIILLSNDVKDINGIFANYIVIIPTMQNGKVSFRHYFPTIDSYKKIYNSYYTLMKTIYNSHWAEIRIDNFLFEPVNKYNEASSANKEKIKKNRYNKDISSFDIDAYNSIVNTAGNIDIALKMIKTATALTNAIQYYKTTNNVQMYNNAIQILEDGRNSQKK